MKILFVAGVASIHVVRWIAQLACTHWDVHIVDPGNSRINSEMCNGKLYTGWRKAYVPSGVNVRYRWPFLRGRHLMQRHFPRIWGQIVPDGPKRIKQVLDSVRPDLVHSLSLPFAAYPVLESIDRYGSLDIPWICSVWGSDLYRHGFEDTHRTKIQRVLKESDYLFTECKRDIVLSQRLGHTGQHLGVVPGGGGFPVSMLRKLVTEVPSHRKIIAIKGYQHPAGRALTALKAIELCASHLSGYEIVVHSSQSIVDETVERLSERLTLPIRVFPRTKQLKLVELFAKSRISLGVSMSDGIPNTMLESMIVGAFPIQTNPGGVTAELVDDNVNGILVPHDDPEAIAEALIEAVENDALVDDAAQVNYDLMLRLVDESVIRPKVLASYQLVASHA
ncbi:MAG: glycosyltransferase [Anaerolineae bacterium]|nr:glycosyltransferase [Anaerolineae bacterium]MCO5187166.1 glycosyltransferase [Anaerolineae bacterium]MCO5195980.1 glycosyltransferase [Anaerolineae bacterium]MCO5199948.1 glycosyltransferase [Anaerolineae bacterium]MCO5207408.1 glycosyltransferase [Anaerolineae bacterium]